MVDNSGSIGHISFDGDKRKEGKPKRSRAGRYKNASSGTLARRRAQNRASQKAYRERKDQRITDLQFLLTITEGEKEVLEKENASLRAKVLVLELNGRDSTYSTPQLSTLGDQPPVTMPCFFQPDNKHGIVADTKDQLAWDELLWDGYINYHSH